MDFSETVTASVGGCRQLIELMKLCEYSRSRSFLDLVQMLFMYAN